MYVIKEFQIKSVQELRRKKSLEINQWKHHIDGENHQNRTNIITKNTEPEESASLLSSRSLFANEKLHRVSRRRFECSWFQYIKGACNCPEIKLRRRGDCTTLIINGERREVKKKFWRCLFTYSHEFKITFQ